MDDVKAPPKPTSDAPKANSPSNTGFAIPVTVAKEEPSTPKGAPEVSLETFDPTAADVPPPAAPDDVVNDDMIPPAPLDTQAAESKPNLTAPSGKSLQELLAEEEAKNPVSPADDPHNKHRRGKGMTILIVVLLILALLAGAAVAYIQTNKKVQPTTTKETTTTTPTTTKVKGTDIDKTSNDLDTSLKKVDDTKDYTSNDLSDTSLGL